MNRAIFDIGKKKERCGVTHMETDTETERQFSFPVDNRDCERKGWGVKLP